MAANAAAVVARPGAALGRAGGGLARGIAVGYLSLIVLVPLGLGIRGWVRNRRIDRAYGHKTLPPLKPPS